MSVIHLASTPSSDTSRLPQHWLWFAGWSFAPSVFECLYTQLPGEHFGIDMMAAAGTLADAAAHISQQPLPENAIWVGWSLGGLVAQHVQALISPAQQPSSLIALASSPQFCQRPNWPHGLNESARHALAQQFEHTPQRALRHFLTLTCHGQPSGVRDLQRYLAAHQYAADSLSQHQYAQLHQQLTWLEHPAPKATPNTLAGTHYWLSRNDALLPNRLHNALTEQGANAQLVDGSHAAFAAQCGDGSILAQLQAVAPCHHTTSQPASASADTPTRKKSAVAKQFSRAAHTYDQAGHVQHLSRTHLLHYLSEHLSGHLSEYLSEHTPEHLSQHKPNRIHGHWLDVGCGTGSALEPLMQCGAQFVTGCDLAEGMLEQAKACAPASNSHRWLCADADALPLANGCVDGVFSNLMLQWSEHTEHTLIEWLRVLKPGGTLALSTLLHGTQHELASTWQHIDQRPHVNQFLTDQQWQNVLGTLKQRDAVRIHVDTSHTHTEHYPSLTDLLHTLKAIGATNVNRGRAVGLGGRNALRQLDQHYPRVNTADGIRLPLTYRLHYLVLQREANNH